MLVVSSVPARHDWTVPALVNLLGHFPCIVDTLPAAQYRAGKVDPYDAVIYLGATREQLPRALVSDLYESQKPVCWIGENLDQLAERFSLGRYGFRLTGKQVTTGDVSYREHRFPAASPRLPEIVVDRLEGCAVIATAATTPYAVRRGNFWYFVENPLRGASRSGSWLILADQLHDVLGEAHPSRRTALLCLTDINPRTSARSVRSLVKTLSAERLPFALAVTPLYRDPARNREARLFEQDDLVGVLQEAQGQGAAIIALGLTYQSAARTGEEAEFWEETRHGPLLERSSEDTHRRLDQAVNELAACNLYPVAWSTPRGLAAPADYSEMAQSFSLAWERRLPGPEAPAPQVFPFLLRREAFGQSLVPENLPALGQGEAAATQLAEARPWEAVRDAWVSFAVTPHASAKEVQALAQELRREGWEFADLRKRDNWVKSTPLQIYTRAEAAPVGDVIPVGWNATLFPSDGADPRRYEHTAGAQARAATLPAGAVLVAYPPGVDLDSAFVVGGRARRLAHRLVLNVARGVTLFAVGACSLFLLIYLGQIALQRRRA